MNEDNFNGDNAQLCNSIDALLALDASGALVPHGVGENARTLLSAAATRLRVIPVAARELDVEAERREPVAWMCVGSVEPEFTADALLAGYWMRKGRTVTPLYEAAPVSTEQAGDAWISVEDRLPAKYEEVMIWPHPSDYCMTAELFGLSASGRPIWKYGEYVTGFGHEIIEMTRPVTHWMPRPAAPSPNNSPAGRKSD